MGEALLVVLAILGMTAGSLLSIRFLSRSASEPESVATVRGSASVPHPAMTDWIEPLPSPDEEPSRPSRDRSGWALAAAASVLLYMLVSRAFGGSSAVVDFQTPPPIDPPLGSIEEEPAPPHDESEQQADARDTVVEADEGPLEATDPPDEATPQLTDSSGIAIRSVVDEILPTQGAPVAIVTIPTLGLEAVVYEGWVIEPDTGWLSHPVERAPQSALPGFEGNLILFGVTERFNQEFAEIETLSAGDQIRITTPEGRFTYALDSAPEVWPKRTWSAAVDGEWIPTSDPDGEFMVDWQYLTEVYNKDFGDNRLTLRATPYISPTESQTVYVTAVLIPNESDELLVASEPAPHYWIFAGNNNWYFSPDQ